MARALLALTLLAASLPVGLPLSSFASECGGGMIVRNESYKEIHVLGFIPCSQNGNVSGCPVQPDLLESSTFDLCCWVKDIPILAMTLDQINSDPTLLPGYRLVLDYVKSGCGNPSPSTVTLHDSISKTLQGDGLVHHMILGPACTVATEPVAELSGKYLNINQVSYTASGTQFQDRERFPRLYTLQPLVFSYNDAYVHLIWSFGWRRVAVINEVDPLFSATATDLRDKLMEAGIAVEHFGSFDSDPSQQLEIIKEMDLRIIVALFTPHKSLARTLWCEAVKQGLADDLHVWFTPVWATLNLEEEVNGSCNNEEIRKALAHTFGTLGSDLVVEKAMLVSGQSAENFYDQLRCYNNAFKAKYSKDPDLDPNNPVDVTFKNGYVYDSIWAIALALNRTIQRGIALENFSYDNDTMADIMQEELRNSNFTGISGQVIFAANGSNETGFRRDPFLEIHQYNGTGKLELRGIYDTSGADISHLHSNFSWPEGGQPADGPTPEPVPYPLWSVCIVAIVTGIGMVCAITCLAVTLAYRKHKAFKMSTFRLNAIICIGIFLGFFGDFTVSLVVHFFLENITVMQVITNLANCLYHISFVLAFGSLLMKTWRIYRIFCNAELRKRKFLDDKYLMLAVGAMLAFVVVVLIVWTSIAPELWVKNEYEDPANLTRKFAVYSASRSQYFEVFLGLLLSTYVVMLLFGMFMAYQIKQNIKSFYNKYNDSPIVNLSSLLALFSFGSLALIVLVPTADSIGFLLLIIVLRDGIWMFPMLGFMYLPMIFELLREKYTGKSIARRGSTFSTRWFSADPDRSNSRRVSFFSISSSAMDEANRRCSLDTSPLHSSRLSSSSLVDGSAKRTSRTLTPLAEEAESMPGEITHSKTSYDVAQASSKLDEDEVFVLQYNQSEVRRPSILKNTPGSDSSPEEGRGSQLHVQFTESQKAT